LITQNHKYFVLNENTLVYSQQPVSSLFGILHGSALRSGPSWLNGPISVNACDTLRPATTEDFHAYRVCVPPDLHA
jgi:hypothetical protein